MGGMFSTPKPIVMPEVKEEPPEVVTESLKGPADKPRRKRGYAETIITGELEPWGKPGKTLLG